MDARFEDDDVQVPVYPGNPAASSSPNTDLLHLTANEDDSTWMLNKCWNWKAPVPAFLAVVTQSEFQPWAVAVRKRDSKENWTNLQQLVCSLSKGILVHGPSSTPPEGAFDTGAWSELKVNLCISEAGEACGLEEDAVREARPLHQGPQNCAWDRSSAN